MNSNIYLQLAYEFHEILRKISPGHFCMGEDALNDSIYLEYISPISKATKSIKIPRCIFEDEVEGLQFFFTS